MEATGAFPLGLPADPFDVTRSHAKNWLEGCATQHFRQLENYKVMTAMS
jgi:hypothetical protein